MVFVKEPKYGFLRKQFALPQCAKISYGDGDHGGVMNNITGLCEKYEGWSHDSCDLVGGSYEKHSGEGYDSGLLVRRHMDMVLDMKDMTVVYREDVVEFREDMIVVYIKHIIVVHMRKDVTVLHMEDMIVVHMKEALQTTKV